MSYLDRKQSSHRTAIIIAVTLIEAAAIYAVVQGLNVTFSRQPPPPPIVGTQIKLDPPPPPLPHPVPSARPSARPDHVTTRPNDFDIAVPSFPIAPLATPTASPVPSPTPDIGVELPRPPQFTPRAARPVGRVSGWATASDYPARDLREGNGGVTGFRLDIGVDGKVVACTITSTSGFPRLDKAACENIARRARFEPASDATGAKVPGSYANTIRWVIPE